MVNVALHSPFLQDAFLGLRSKPVGQSASWERVPKDSRFHLVSKALIAEIFFIFKLWGPPIVESTLSVQRLSVLLSLSLLSFFKSRAVSCSP